MNLLDRHIFASVLGTCAAAVGLFAFVVALPNIVRELLGPLLAGQISLIGFLRFVWLFLLYATSFALPMGILTGVLLTLGRLSADSEITAMRASGIGVVRLARPIFLLGFLCAGLALYINLEASPRARVQFQRDLAEAVRADPLSFIVPKTFIRDFRNTVIYVGEKNGHELRDIWLWELDDQRRVRRVVRAESGRIAYDEATNSLVPTLLRAKTEERDPDNPEDFGKSPKAPSVDKADEWRIPLEGYLSRSSYRMKQEWLPYADLLAEQARLAAPPAQPLSPEKQRDRAHDQMKTKLIEHERFNLSLAVFSFALIGVPLGIKVSRRETSANLGLALGLVLGYYLLTVIVKWLDRRPELRPDLLMWVPNLAFIALGLWLFTRIDRR